MASSNPNKRSLEPEEDEETGSPKRSKEENGDSSSSESSSDSSSSDSSSDSSEGSDSEEEETESTSKTPSDLRVCPLRSLMSHYGNGDDFSPILNPDHGPSDLSGPVDPIFVMNDEESSGEAVAHAADQEFMPAMPPLPELELDKPPEPLKEEPLDQMEVNEEEEPPTPLESIENTDSDLDSDFDVVDEELEAAIAQAAEKGQGQKEIPIVAERTKFKLVDKGQNHFDVLPNGWVAVPHVSGMPIYLHRPTRSVTLSRPYHLGAASARRHPVPRNAIPCLNYKKALEAEEETEKAQQNSIFPVAKVESVEDNIKKASLDPNEVREYCQKLFVFKQETVRKFRSWADRRSHQKQERDQTIQDIKSKIQNNEKSRRPALPNGTKIISIPVVELEQEDPNVENPLRQKVIRKSKKDWVLNPAGKSTVCILHEYLQHSIKKAPIYKFDEMDSSATPYSALTIINGIEYGRGVGSSKKEAKSEAARLTLEILIPEFKKNLTAKNGYVIKENADLSFFNEISVEDPRVAELCNKMAEPSPYAILLNCLSKNYGLGDTSIHTDLARIEGRKGLNKFTMTVNGRSVQVRCQNKRDGKQKASQSMLQLLHPHIKSWGSLLELYGSRAIAAAKNKKERESEVTGLQTANGAAGHASPNVAILAKLREEMKLLSKRKKSCIGNGLGKLTIQNTASSNTEMANTIPDRISL